MGAVDLVVQVEAPPSRRERTAARRPRRAPGRRDLPRRAVPQAPRRPDPLRRHRRADAHGADRGARVPANPLDILAQQTVAASALEPIDVEEWFDAVRRSGAVRDAPPLGVRVDAGPARGPLPVRRVRRAAAPAGLGSRRRHPHRPARVAAPRRHLRRHHPRPRPVRRLHGRRQKASSRVGELDEEMVYESRVGDVFALGATSWRIEEITHDRVLVSPALRPARPAAVLARRRPRAGPPNSARRSASSCASCRSATRDEAAPAAASRARRQRHHQPARAGRRAAAGHRRSAHRPHPGGRTVPRRARRLATGAALALRAAGARAVGARGRRPPAGALRRRRRADRVRRRHHRPPARHRGRRRPARTVRRSTATRSRTSSPTRSAARPCSRPGSASAPPARCCCRAATPASGRRCGSSGSGRRSCSTWPASTRRSRSCSRRCANACRTSTTCPRCATCSARVARRQIRLVEVETASPSPFASALLFDYVGAFMYEGDSPLAERRAAALSLDSTLLAELLGRVELRELLDADVIADDRARTAAPGPGPARPRRRGRRRPAAPARALTADEVAARADGRRRGSGSSRTRGTARAHDASRSRAAQWWAAIEDAGRLRDALGVPLPIGTPAGVHRAGRRPARRPGRPLRAHPRPVHARRGRRPVRPRHRRRAATCCAGSRARGASSRASSGPAAPAASGATPRCCGACGAARWPRPRQDVEPVEPAALGRFLPRWQHVGQAASRGIDGVAAVIEQLAGVPIPASAWESLILRVAGARLLPAMLDELTATGEVLWSGAGQISGKRRLGVPAPGRLGAAHRCPTPAEIELSEHAPRVLDALGGGGAYFFRQLSGQRLGVHRRRARSPPRCGIWCGRGTSAATRSPRCAR